MLSEDMIDVVVDCRMSEWIGEIQKRSWFLGGQMQLLYFQAMFLIVFELSFIHMPERMRRLQYAILSGLYE
jgi:hypothetical protein